MEIVEFTQEPPKPTETVTQLKSLKPGDVYREEHTTYDQALMSKAFWQVKQPSPSKKDGDAMVEVQNIFDLREMRRNDDWRVIKHPAVALVKRNIPGTPEDAAAAAASPDN